MSKFAVIGDSYAVIDDKNSHWAKLWADKNGHEVSFYGLEGSNLVNIAYLVDNINLKNYDGVIIHYTSPLRAEGAYYKDDNKKLSIVSQMADVYSCESKEIFKYFLPNTPNIDEKEFNKELPNGLETQYYVDESKYKYIINFFNVMPHWYENFNMIDSDTSSFDSIMTKMCNDFYGSVSIRWLVRANFLAYRNIVLSLNEKSVKNITVFPTCGGFEQTIAHLREKYPTTNIWDQSQISQLHPSQTESRNHVSLEIANQLANNFIFP